MAKKIKLKTPVLLITFIIIIILALIYIFSISKQKNGLSDFPTVNESLGKIVEGFPKFPVYPGSKVESSQITGAYKSQPISYQAYLESSDSVEKIINWYSSSLQSDGWQIVRPIDSSQADDQNFIVRKGKTLATINVEHEGDSTFISIYIQ